jgi:hypothetical protein
MALKFIEGFESFGTNLDTDISGHIGYGWWYNGVEKLVAGRISGYGLSDAYASDFDVANSNIGLNAALDVNDTIIAGLAFQHTVAGVSTWKWHYTPSYTDADMGVNLLFNTSAGTITVRFGTTTLETIAATLAVGIWYYVELKVYSHPTAGTIEIKLNGTTICSLTNQVTSTASVVKHNWFSYFWGMRQKHSWIDDIYVFDSTGDTCNDFANVPHVIGIFPDGDSSVAWTPSTGSTNFNLVDETLDNDIDYVSTSTQGATDLYNYEHISGTGSILGIQVKTTCQIASGVSCIFESAINTGGTTYFGDDVTVSSATDTHVRHISEVNPATGLPWTMSQLNAATIGMRVM